MSPAAAAATWDRQAERYDAQEHLQAAAIRAAVRLTAPRAGDAVVDLATGTGVVLRALAALPIPPTSVIGVDRSAGMLAAGGPPPHGWTLLEADARAVPLPAACADVVTCAYLLHLLDVADRRAVLLEARRLLRPAGRLVLVTVWTDRRRAGGRVAGRLLAGAARVAPERLGGLRPLDPSGDLAAAGFTCTGRVQLPRGGYPSLVLRAEDRTARPSRG